jgi:hypothetical protein
MDNDILNDEERAARRRREIFERIIFGQTVVLKPGSCELTTLDDSGTGENTIKIPSHKEDFGRYLKRKPAASFYWYERDPELLEAEKKAMQNLFPNFQLEKLEDGRLCWIGNLNPSGDGGGIWTVKAIYQPDHPNNRYFGGSVRMYSIKPDLDELYEEQGTLPHVLRDDAGHFYMFIAQKEDVDTGVDTVTSAAKSLDGAAKWIWMVEGWLRGDLGQEVFDHTFWKRHKPS